MHEGYRGGKAESQSSKPVDYCSKLLARTGKFLSDDAQSGFLTCGHLPMFVSSRPPELDTLPPYCLVDPLGDRDKKVCSPTGSQARRS
jgi:hypothetical protein